MYTSSSPELPEASPAAAIKEDDYDVPPKESRENTLKKHFFRMTYEKQLESFAKMDKFGLLPEYSMFLFNTHEPCLCSELAKSAYYFRGEFISADKLEKLKLRETINPNCFKDIRYCDRTKAYRSLIKKAGVDENFLNDTELKRLVDYAEEPLPDGTRGPVDPEHSEQPFSGLVNMGLTCYFNAALQSLFSNIEFRSIIYSYKPKEAVSEGKASEQAQMQAATKEEDDNEYDDDDCENVKMKSESSDVKMEAEGKKEEEQEQEEIGRAREKVVLELQKLFAEMEFSVLSRVSTGPLLNAMGLRLGVQQDASEFYEVFMQMISSVFSKNSEDLKERLEKCNVGKIQYETTCVNCHNVSISKDLTSQLKLPICDDLTSINNSNDSDDDDDEDDDDDDDDYYMSGKTEDKKEDNKKKKKKKNESASLITLVQKYFDKEEIEGRYCENCKLRCNANRIMKCTYLPDELTIGLLTFGYNMAREISEKVIKPILIPEALDMSKYLADGVDCESSYVLSTVICHIGLSADSGHYIAYVKKYGKWWEFDDSAVRVLVDLPFKLADADGNPVPMSKEAQEKAAAEAAAEKREASASYWVRDWSKWVYDYKKRDYVLRKKVKPEDSVTPFMVFYQKRSVAESEKSECPRDLRDLVVSEAVKVKALFDSSKAASDAVKKKVYDFADVFDGIIESAPVPPQNEEYYWVPTEWLRRVRDSIFDDDDGDGDDDDKLKIYTKAFLCPHGKLGPKSTASLKRISPEAWTVLREKYGLVDGDPVLNAASECDVCARAYGMELRDECLSKAKQVELWEKDRDINDNYNYYGKEKDFYYVGLDFYRSTFKDIYYEKSPLPKVVTQNPTESITCVHKGFLPKDAKKVSVDTWEWIKSHASDEVREKMVVFQKGAKPCRLCGISEEEIKSMKKKLSSYIEYSSYYEKDKECPTYPAKIDIGQLYYVMKRSWFTAIKDNCSEWSPKPMKEDLDFGTLLCKHGNFYEDIDVILDYTNGTHIFVPESYWVTASRL